jgi:peptidyl-prolyl cis-trans isomerase C
MIQVRSKVLPAAFALAMLSPLAHAQTAATVNGKPIPESLVDAIAQSMAQRSGHPATPQIKEQIKKQLIMRTVIVQQAEKEGLAKDPQVKDELAMTHDDVLIRALLGKYLKEHPITDAQVQAKYAEFTKSFGNTEYEAQHILVRTEKQADEIIADLKKGDKFGELAKKYSKDTASAANDGKLGWSTPGNYVPPFAEALTKLKVGQYTTKPVQTQFGWHVIKLDATRPAKPPTLDQLKPQIEQELQRETVQAYQQKLLSQAKVSEK